MNSEWIIWLFEGVIVFAALAILLNQSVFHAGLNLLIVVISIGVIYGLYGSEFLMISQILIYGGGILVLILFATMVTASKPKEKKEFNAMSIPLFFVIAAVLVLITVYVMAYQPNGVPYVVSTKALGLKLIEDFSLPLEISGILLLVALIGSVITAIQKPTVS